MGIGPQDVTSWRLLGILVKLKAKNKAASLFALMMLVTVSGDDLVLEALSTLCVRFKFFLFFFKHHVTTEQSSRGLGLGLGPPLAYLIVMFLLYI